MDLGHGHRRTVVIMWAWTAVLSGFVLIPVFTGRGDGIVPIGLAALALLLFTLLAPRLRRGRNSRRPAVVQHDDGRLRLVGVRPAAVGGDGVGVGAGPDDRAGQGAGRLAVGDGLDAATRARCGRPTEPAYRRLVPPGQVVHQGQQLGVDRLGVEQHEVGVGALGDHAAVAQAEQLGGHLGQHLHRPLDRGQLAAAEAVGRGSGSGSRRPACGRGGHRRRSRRASPRGGPRPDAAAPRTRGRRRWRPATAPCAGRRRARCRAGCRTGWPRRVPRRCRRPAGR